MEKNKSNESCSKREKDHKYGYTFNMSMSRNKKLVNSDCRRYATVRVTQNAGLGHRFGEIVFGMLLAEVTNSTYVLDETSLYGPGIHGSYEWFRSFLPLSMTEYTLDDYENENLGSELRKIQLPLDEMKKFDERNRSECNTFVESRSNSCCKNNQRDNPAWWCWCFTALSGAYEKIRWRLAEAYEFSTFEPTINLYKGIESELVVSWHIRAGDFSINKGNVAYFETVMSQVVALSGRIPLHIFFLGEDVKVQYPFLESICHNHSTICSFPELESGNSFYHLVHSDMLITSGSSFPYASALFHRGVVINAPPKEGGNGIYELSDHSQMNSEGFITKPTLSELHHQLHTIHLRKIYN